MKNVFKVVLIIVIASLNCFTSCEEDECDFSKMDTAMTVDVYAWGDVKFINQNNEDVTASFAGTHFSIQYYKHYCDGKTSDIFGFDYYSLASGVLDKDGVGSYSFTMNNTEDKIYFDVYYHSEDSFGASLLETLATYHEWNQGQVRFEILITVNVGSDNTINPENIQVSYNFLDPVN